MPGQRREPRTLRVRVPAAVGAAILAACVFLPPPANAEESGFDPRKPPEAKAVKAEVAAVKKAWKRADVAGKGELLARLEVLDHELSAAAIGELITKAETEVHRRGLAALRKLHEYYVAQVLPKLLSSAADNDTWKAVIDLAVEKQVHEILPDVRKIAAEFVVPDGDAQAMKAVLKRVKAIETLGLIPHEENLPILVEIMERHAALENERIAHGDAGSDASWPRYYVPARFAFTQITKEKCERAAQARAWLDTHPDWKFERPARVHPIEKK